MAQPKPKPKLAATKPSVASSGATAGKKPNVVSGTGGAGESE